MPRNQEDKSLSKEYNCLLNFIKEKIHNSREKMSVAVNSELIHLYWDIGFALGKWQKEEERKDQAKRLSEDLQFSFPNIRGFSITNIKYMIRFAEAYPNMEFGQQLVDQIPWGHNLLIMKSLRSSEERLWYVQKTVENGWNRRELYAKIDSGFYKREKSTATNFTEDYSLSKSTLAEQILQDFYCFEFLTIRKYRGRVKGDTV